MYKKTCLVKFLSYNTIKYVQQKFTNLKSVFILTLLNGFIKNNKIARINNNKNLNKDALLWK